MGDVGKKFNETVDSFRNNLGLPNLDLLGGAKNAIEAPGNLIKAGKSLQNAFTRNETSAIDALISDAEEKKKKEAEEAANIALRLQRQMMAAFALEKSGSLAYKRGGTLLTSPLGLQDPTSTGKVKKSAIGA